jgi:hypothetical protein
VAQQLEQKGEGSGSEDLHLISDLKGGDGEIADGDESNNIKEGGNGKLPAIGAESFAEKLIEVPRHV